MKDFYYITLNSDSKCAFKELNNPTEYTVHLEKTLLLEGNWEIALVDIYIPNTIRNVPERICSFSRHAEYIIDTDGEAESQYKKTIDHFTLKPACYANTNQLLEALNKSAKNHLKATIDKNHGIYDILKKIGRARFEMHPKLLEILGMTVAIEGASSIKSVYPIDLKRGLPEKINVSLDIIEEQLFNNTHAKILRTFALDRNKYEHFNTTHVEFQRLIFIPIVQNKIDSIKINISDENLDQIYFERGVVTVTLLLRKKP